MFPRARQVHALTCAVVVAYMLLPSTLVTAALAGSLAIYYGITSAGNPAHTGEKKVLYMLNGLYETRRIRLGRMFCQFPTGHLAFRSTMASACPVQQGRFNLQTRTPSSSDAVMGPPGCLGQALPRLTFLMAHPALLVSTAMMSETISSSFSTIASSGPYWIPWWILRCRLPAVGGVPRVGHRQH